MKQYGLSPRNRKTEAANRLDVEGVGRKNVAPDQAVLSIGFRNEDTNIQTAQRENAVTSNQIIEAIQGLGVDQTNIQTSDYTINVRYDYRDGEQIFRGYVVTHLLRITVDDLALVGPIIDIAVTNGANLIQNIQFSLNKPDKFYQEALVLAMADAKTKAEVIVSTFTGTLEPMPIKVIEKIEEHVVPYTRVLSTSSYAPEETPIQSGQIEITAKVIVSYMYI